MTCRPAGAGGIEKKGRRAVETIDAIARCIALVVVLLLTYGAILDALRWRQERRRKEGAHRKD